MNKKVAKIAFVLIGVLALVLALISFTAEVGFSESDNRYGGDAYTGIQYAAAQTARNLVAVGEMLQKGIGSILVVHGLAFITIGISIQNTEKEFCATPTKETDQQKEVTL